MCGRWVVYEEPHTHPVPKTLASRDASPLARALWMEIRDVVTNEQAHEICERYLDLARMEGPRNAET